MSHVRSAPCIRSLIPTPSVTPFPTASASVKPSPNQPPPKLQFNNITVPAVQIIPRGRRASIPIITRSSSRPCVKTYLVRSNRRARSPCSSPTSSKWRSSTAASSSRHPSSTVSARSASRPCFLHADEALLPPPSGSWHSVAPDPQLGSSSTYVYSAALVFPEDEEDLPDGRIELQFDLFTNATKVEISNVVSFLVTPEKAKLTLRVFDWPWDSIKETYPDVPSELEIRLAIDPVVKQAQRSEEGRITTFDLNVDRNATSSSSDTMQIRLVDVVELDSFLILKGGVWFDVDVESSELVLSFAYFNRSLIYDPGTLPLASRRRRWLRSRSG